MLLLNSLSDQPAKKQILWRRSIKVEFGHFFTFHQFFSPKFLVKFWNFFFPRGVIDYAEFKKNKISVIRQRLNGAQFRVFTLSMPRKASIVKPSGFEFGTITGNTTTVTGLRVSARKFYSSPVALEEGSWFVEIRKIWEFKFGAKIYSERVALKTPRFEMREKCVFELGAKSYSGPVALKRPHFEKTA